MKLIAALSDILFPPKCILCGKVLENGEIDLCRTCRKEAPEHSKGKLKLQFLDSWTAIWYYEGNVRRSLLRFKFYRVRHLASGFGRLLAVRLEESGSGSFDLITWVPISPIRRLSRGYDQDELLAQALGRELGLRPVKLLRKTRNNPPQSGITGQAQRKANVLGIYRAVDAELIRGKRILLVDDILTTGATAGECARVLLTAGAKEVHCAVVAAVRK